MSKQPVLTTVQKQTLDYIEGYIQKHSESPLLTDIQKHFELSSKRSASQRLEALEKKGYITRDRFKHRSIRLVNHDIDSLVSSFVQVPIIASVGCDQQSIYAQTDVSGYLSVEKSITKSKNIVAFQAAGNSMVDAGVNNGDYVLVEQTSDVVDGDRVVAIVEDMAVLKRLQTTNNAVVLHPEARGYNPIILRDNSKIFGKLVEVISVGTKQQEDEWSIVPINE